METNGIIYFNRGDKCAIRLLVSLYSLRKHYGGNITVYLEKPYPENLEKACEYFDVDIVQNETKLDMQALIRKTDMFGNPPYDRTLWLDADTVVLGKIDEMFDYLDDYDCSIPNFCDWISTGRTISKRIKQFQNIASDKFIEKALEPFAAINTGVFSFKRSDKWNQFVKDWVTLAHEGSKKHIFIADEIAAQVLLPSISEWGLSCYIAPKKFNVSVKYGNDVEDKRILHAHGQKHVQEMDLCNLWKKEFNEMKEKNVANINDFLQFSDKRLSKYLNIKRDKTNNNFKIKTIMPKIEGDTSDITIVTACDEYYIDILRETFANWRKYKSIDTFPVIVFVHGINLEDKRLDFLKLPNVQLIPWSMSNAENHREEMLSAFVLGSAEHVKTEYWIKLDADSFATDYRPIYNEEMKKFAFFGHKWTYSRPQMIQKLDEWAKKHDKPKLKNALPMFKEGRAEGNRFFHNKKRTISFIQFHRSKFVRFCVKLLKEPRLPVPSHDTFLFYVCDRFDPTQIGIGNFKKNHGFTQGRGKLGAKHIKEQLDKVDELNKNREQNNAEVLKPVNTIKVEVKELPIISTNDLSVVEVKKL